MGAREEFDGFVEVAPSRGRGLKLEIFAGDKFYQQSPLHGGVD